MRQYMHMRTLRDTKCTREYQDTIAAHENIGRQLMHKNTLEDNRCTKDHYILETMKRQSQR